MLEILGSTLPVFLKYDLARLKNGLDFIGINHYSSFFIKDCFFSVCKPGPGNSRTEGFILRTAEKNGIFIGEPVCYISLLAFLLFTVFGAQCLRLKLMQTDVEWLYVYPQGMNKIVTYIKERFHNIPMYITENGEMKHGHQTIALTFGRMFYQIHQCDCGLLTGLGEKDNSNSSIDVQLNDVKRVKYMSSYLDALAAAVRYVIYLLVPVLNFISIFGTVRHLLKLQTYPTILQT